MFGSVPEAMTRTDVLVLLMPLSESNHLLVNFSCLQEEDDYSLNDDGMLIKNSSLPAGNK